MNSSCLLRKFLYTAVVICLSQLRSTQAAFPDPPTPAPDPQTSIFLVKPYLQLGAVPSAECLSLLWHTADQDADWRVTWRTEGETAWHTAASPTHRRVNVPTVPPRRIYHTTLQGFARGVVLEYQVSKGGASVFTARTLTRKKQPDPYRFVAFGDCGVNSPEQKAIAFQTYELKPDFVVITGDIVYDRGRVSEYQTRFWPIYNSDEASSSVGAPLMRSTLFISAPGNHDIAGRDLERYPDGLAYFFYWNQPLNGPIGKEGGPLVPLLKGPESAQSAFRQAGGEAYPRMANFSFDYNNAHWTVLDANPYVDWTDPGLRKWVEQDLASAKNATWRFVAFHHPGFNSSKAHFEQQQMRLMADIFEAADVDIVFNGHVHNYQRTYPLTFKVDKDKAGKPITNKQLVPGKWTLDKNFDGKANSRAKGVIYLITGAGGNHLYDVDQQDKPETWQSFTHKFVSKVNSLTVVDIDGSSAAVRQLTADGTEVDRFMLTK